MLQKVVSYQVADSIDVKRFSSSFTEELYYHDQSELFYRTGAEQYVYIFKYGAVCFLNYRVRDRCFSSIDLSLLQEPF